MLSSSIAEVNVLLPASTDEAGGYQISGFTREDAADIPHAFEAVYGRDYLNPLVYDARGFADLVISGKQISFIARDADGELAGHLALAFSAPNRRLVEVAQGIVTPAHRKSGIFARLMERAVAFARDELDAQAVFGAALTNHVISQRVLAACSFRDVALEVDYVPHRMLLRERAGGPAATLVQYLDLGRQRNAPCHLPPSYAGWYARLLDSAAATGQRRITSTNKLDRRSSISEATDMPRFDMSRLLVRRAGCDFLSQVASHEFAAESTQRRTFQVLVNLTTSEGAAAVELLRSWGYASGGVLPAYLEDGQHAAIMYRSFAAPYFTGVKMHDANAQLLLSNVVTDWWRAARLNPQARRDPGYAAVHAVPQSARFSARVNAGTGARQGTLRLNTQSA